MEIDLVGDCKELILSIFEHYKNGEAITPSIIDSMYTVERILKII